jgi:predicted O-linked N-acetylglucosamine transferase (SPINDLY family)
MSRADELLRQARADAAAGRLDGAVAALRRLAAREPRNAAAHAELADLLQRSGQAVQAAYFAERAVQLDPGNADALNTLGYARMTAGRHAAAVETFERALAISPTHLRALSNLCGVLGTLGRLDEAVAAMRRVVAAHPDTEFAYADANVLLRVGMAREAAALLREAVGRFPRAVWLRRDLCVALNYTDDADEAEVLRAHALLGASLPPAGQVEPENTDPERPLRVGYVSPDFREHSVASFLRAVLSPHEGIIPVCYHAAPRGDSTTERLRGWVRAARGEWHDVSALNNTALVERMRRDRLDIAIDLAGWTAGSRLFALAARVAPVQASYLGYPNTTGVPAMDWRLVDSHTDPPEADGLATERLHRLDPCFLCYSPPDEAASAPDPAAGFASAPATSGAGRPITFGSFNTIRKVTPTTVRLWAGAMRATEGSRMLIKSVGLNSTLARGHLLALFDGEGVAPERIELLDRVESRAEHLALYGRVDVALDTFPYHGTTTTCEALWMGVPVVTLAGPAHRSRVGSSLLTAAGLPDLVARTPEQFASLAAGLARDRGRLAGRRASLRRSVQGSALCDAGAFGGRFAAALRRLWRVRCGRAG